MMESGNYYSFLKHSLSLKLSLPLPFEKAARWRPYHCTRQEWYLHQPHLISTIFIIASSSVPFAISLLAYPAAAAAAVAKSLT
ncbi:neurogenic differentiation factor 1 [Plakobranchus ocellatus]|uniref:Neurogenic differentiation factor 1 n=1 Tax=Plakobranchus ocellatus TaxID=259542 RepID=A0AAV4BTX2_9GAST|nr:neurogenic differentiation factor 1 [Plakobranchus ocellatus]